MAEEYILTRPATLSISAEDADRLLALGSGDAALLYLWLLRNGGRYDPAKAARELKTAAPLAESMARLRAAGLIRGEGNEELPRREAPVREELPEVTAEEVTRQAEADPGFRRLLSETAERLGRVLTGGDMKILFGIYHDLGLPTEVILLLLSFCVSEVQRLYGPGRKPTLRQVEKEAYIWFNRELLTLEQAEGYLKDRQARRGKLGELRELLGIQNRAPAPTEEKYMLSWLEMGFGREAILRAYDKTINKKGDLTWPYMNRILENWHAKGLHTLPEIEAGDQPPGKRSQAGRSGAAKPAGPTSEEYQRMQRYLKKLDGGGDHGT